MKILVKNIEWDTEGESLDEFDLPEHVLLIDPVIDEEYFALRLLNVFGCATKKIEWEVIKKTDEFVFRKKLAVIL